VERTGIEPVTSGLQNRFRGLGETPLGSEAADLPTQTASTMLAKRTQK
jgi:hypothetical protein